MAALESVANAMQSTNPAYAFGASRAQFRKALAELAIARLGDTQVVGDEGQAAMFAGFFADWWAVQTRLRKYFIPCAIIPSEAEDFQVGPVKFVHWKRFATHPDGIPADRPGADLAREELAQMLNAGSASWVAIVEIEGALPKRSEELADLAVDVALVGVQLVVPIASSRGMTRLTARTVPALRSSIFVSEDGISGGGANQMPGLKVSGPELTLFLRKGYAIVSAVGQRLAPFVTGRAGTLRRLDQAWCDSAYWFHEGLAEPLDSVAVAKLETAIEVLLRTENTRGSGARIRQAIEAVTGLKRDEHIAPDSIVTVDALAKQLVVARSRVLHGTFPTLSVELASERNALLGLAHRLLTATATALGAFSLSPGANDDVDEFLSWMLAAGCQAT